MEKKAERWAYLDILRIIACICVVFNHTTERGFYMFALQEPGSAAYYVQLFLSMLCKLAVPVFLGISGALMLGREIALKKLWLGRIVRIGAVLAVFSLLSYIEAIAMGHAAPGLKTFIFGMYDTSWNYALWYLYAYLAFLMVSPLLSSMVKGMSDSLFLYFLAVAFVFRCLVPGFEQLHWKGVHQLNPDFSLACITCDIVLYPCMGYFFHRRMKEGICRRAAPVLLAVSALLTAAACYMTCRQTLETGIMYNQAYHELFAPVLCAAAFASVKGRAGRIAAESRCGKILTTMARHTFGIYLVHVFVLNRTQLLDAVWGGLMALHMPMVIAGWLYTAVIFAFSYALVWALRKIPGVARLIA